ncbi:MAG: class I SAM-dependent methyltransferase [Methylobacterium sp.]|uniref:class I SAM-dependent methyltransferase n=1 Tax=Methylobacterium sp. TaxID=409 RepID=UPI0025DB5D42|nr:methyltransferase domain-containing protein [Methylobacterium sp.]MBX9932017.1 class I SAM-dependent methyltransferase [Methylobacterium sp.]
MAGSTSPIWLGQQRGVPGSGGLADLVDTAKIGRRTDAAWSELKPTLERLVNGLNARSVLEIGGGRHPFLGLEEAERNGFRLAVNDLDAEELKYAPSGYDRVVFDVARDIDRDVIEMGAYDLVFSRMVFEHVRDARKAWSNVRDLLAPGGVGLAFVPTLYSPPFVLNRLMPEVLTSRLVSMLDRSRNAAEIPKFPAYYQACRASEESLRPFLMGLGFREVCVVPFFGTPYFPRIPVLAQVARAFDRLAEARDWRVFASYAYIVARK